MGRGKSGVKSKGGGDGTFSQMTDAEEKEYYAKQKITAAQQKAFDKYTDPNTESGSLYNFSQNMNRAIATDTPLTKKQQEVYDQITGSMHTLGRNMELTRYDHYDTVNEMLSKLGVSGDASTMSAEQLSDALVGASYTDKRILSTSVNGFKNSSNPETFTSRQFKFTYMAKSGAMGVMPGVGKKPMKGSGKKTGDDFGEMLLGSSNKYKIVGVRNSGEMARRKGRPTWDRTTDQIEIIVEVG